jgi:hypothetical protein
MPQRFDLLLLLRDEDLKKIEENAKGSGSSTYFDNIVEIYSQLEGIAGITARYAVMETLYRQARGMSLQSDYQAALIRLCCEILKWFATAFSVSGPFSVLRGLNVSGKLWATIKDMDRACQKFKIIVEAPGDDIQSDVDEDIPSEAIWC